MDNISPHISYKEGIVSVTGTRLGIDNTPTPEILATMKVTAVKLFEPLREHFGQPLRIISFYRCPALNSAVGGAKKSSHMNGEAIDVQGINGVTNADIFRYFKYNDVEFDQIIAEFPENGEPQWVHISYRSGNNRGEMLIAKKDKGRTVYYNYFGNESLMK